MKGERVAQLELILKAHPEGLRKSDIARRIGVHRSTVGRYIEDLKKYSDVYEENNLVKISVKDTEEKLDLSVYESLALNMGAEMLLNNSEFQSPHLASGLRKIAMHMNGYAPKVSRNIIAIAEEAEKANIKGSGRKYNDVLEVLIDSWISGRMVKIKHSRNGIQEETELAPYFIGFVEGENGRNPITVTGRLRHTTEIVTLDINNILNVELLNETYTIPDNLKVFKKNDEVASVSNVIDTIPLTLIVKEKSALNAFRTLAHSEIQTQTLPDGKIKCVFEAENSIELFLRIVQCFDSVEVAGPEKYRNRIVSTLKQILSIYE